MAYIKVDHSKFSGAVSAVDDYVGQLKSKMKSAESEVNSLISGWDGDDYTQFKKQWSTLQSKGSAYSEMVKALEAYSDFLQLAANKYKEAQTNAVNRANSLPRW